MTSPLIHKAIFVIIWCNLTYIFTEHWPTIHYIFWQIFKAQDLRKNFQLEPRQLPKPILEYVNACIEITWLMCIQDPPMVITWASERETINTNYYKCYKTSGNTVKLCVWPLLLLHSKGPTVSKGYILPNER